MFSYLYIGAGKKSFAYNKTNAFKKRLFCRPLYIDAQASVWRAHAVRTEWRGKSQSRKGSFRARQGHGGRWHGGSATFLDRAGCFLEFLKFSVIQPSSLHVIARFLHSHKSCRLQHRGNLMPCPSVSNEILQIAQS